MVELKRQKFGKKYILSIWFDADLVSRLMAYDALCLGFSSVMCFCRRGNFFYVQYVF